MFTNPSFRNEGQCVAYMNHVNKHRHGHGQHAQGDQDDQDDQDDQGNDHFHGPKPFVTAQFVHPKTHATSKALHLSLRSRAARHRRVMRSLNRRS